eukprot:scaffold2591_cov46-Phaeocystis_antarctica.AAC.3
MARALAPAQRQTPTPLPCRPPNVADLAVLSSGESRARCASRAPSRGATRRTRPRWASTSTSG